MWSIQGESMKRVFMYKISAIFVTAFGLLVVTSHAIAQSETEKTYKTKCVACHAADGSGSEVGKKLGTHEFSSADVQKMSDADLTGLISNGKNKMPAYGKNLKPEEIKALV